MKNAIKFSVLSYLLIILLLAVSGSVGGVVGRAVYFSAFILPPLLILPFAKKCGLPLYPVSFKTDARGMCYTGLTLFPFILCVMAISFLITLLLNALGYNSETELEGSLISVILLHAVLPALCEELVFRYLPIRLIAPHSPRCAVVLSSVAFALTHCNLYQIPYALFAGSVFAFVTLVTGSIIPSMILHFINNTVSVIWMRSPELTLPIIIVIAVIAVISLVYVFIRRREYSAWVREAASGEPIGRCPELVIAMVILLAAAILNLR